MSESREQFKERITGLWGEVYAEAMYEERHDPDARTMCQNAATMAVYTQAIRDILSELGRPHHRLAMERIVHFAVVRGLSRGISHE